MFKKPNNQKGFNLLEIILAVSVFALSGMGLSLGIIYGEQSILSANIREQALLLAREGLDASRNIANADFSDLVDGNFGLVVAGNMYEFSGTYDIWDIYTREIFISTIDANTKEVVSRVSWPQNASREGSLELATYITNWR